MHRIMVAMSGGVDSSVAAMLLQQKGYEVVGVTMCLGVASPDSSQPTCCGPQAVRDARRVCDQLGIAHYVFDYAEPLRTHVIDTFIDEYARGRTPNPCVLCNRYLKFDSLLHKATAMGFDSLATGHYARLAHERGAVHMLTAVDEIKDQTYFLARIERTALARVLFPAGEYTKECIRQLARDSHLPVAEKGESQDICFIPHGDYRSFVAERVHAEPGPFVDRRGVRLGTHTGITNYTIGQRKGLGVAVGTPLYVVDIWPQDNTVVLGPREQLLSTGLIATGVNLLCDTLPPRAQAKVRYSHAPAPCSVSFDDQRLTVTFDTPQESVTPGQAVVLYDGETVLAGATIDCRLMTAD
ncbi:MAG: tRNA 2-thiouridine(34) synthase MnmA [Chitinivibrionales bacterium]|nr:tRNA 2-thiouridine(34) synthase MnmA [Chitinivibrionales bacterium]